MKKYKQADDGEALISIIKLLAVPFVLVFYLVYYIFEFFIKAASRLFGRGKLQTETKQSKEAISSTSAPETEYRDPRPKAVIEEERKQTERLVAIHSLVSYEENELTEVERAAAEADTVDKKIELTKKLIHEYESFRRCCYSHGSAGVEYFSVFYEHCHNTHNPDFSMVDEAKKRLNKLLENYDELKYRENLLIEMPSGLFDFLKNNNGIIQKDVYSHFDPSIKSEIQQKLWQWAKDGKIQREKHGSSYIITVDYKPDEEEWTYLNAPLDYKISCTERMKTQLRETEYLLNKTVNPEVFWSRLNFIIDILQAMKELEKENMFSDFSPSQKYESLFSNLDLTVKEFLKRAAKAEYKYIKTLKTNEAKQKRLEQFHSAITKSFKNASNYWGGNYGYPHYTGPLFHQSSVKYFEVLFKKLSEKILIILPTSAKR